MSGSEARHPINDFNAIADFYDQLVAWAPYGRWTDDLLKRLRRHGLKTGARLLDLACGTGLSTEPLARAGFVVVGVDRAENMLRRARQRMEGSGLRVSFVRSELSQLDLRETFDAAVCVHSGLDYILDMDELAEVFRRVRGHLRAGGLFAFDKCLDEPGFYRESRTDSRILKDATAILHYSWDSQEKIFEQRCVVMWPDRDGDIQRVEVVHKMRAVSVRELEGMLAEAGFEMLEAPEQFSVPDPGMGIFRAV
jgi:ubiquinone/menaquinone biosynthesis C-methylase UbiE